MSTSGPSGAPPRKKLSGRDAKKWEKLLKDKEKIEELRADAKASEFFDHASPTVRDARARTRARFEEYIEVCYNVTEIPEIWNAATIVDRTKEFLGGLAVTQTGLFNNKIKASSLWIAKHCIYWWAVRFIPDFSTVYHAWHNKTVAYVHYIAIKGGLRIAFHEKNNLTDVELAMSFAHIMRQEYGVENYKQHYAAMLLAWTTSARPGSFTVSKGYHQGASMGIKGIFRETAQTLYWKDIKFRRLNDGSIAARVNLRYHKVYRNLHTQEASFEPSRKFTMMPTMGTRFEFDLSLILLGLAWSRGLFIGYNSLEDILNGEDQFLKVDQDIKEQPIFVQANRTGGIEPTKPIRVDARNAKLQDLCISIGLMGRNTYYSFHRTAIIETLRKDGMDAAQKIAFHAPTTNSVSLSYDNEGMANTDITTYHQELVNRKMSSAEIRRWYGQANACYDSEGSTAPADLQNALKLRVDEAKLEDPQYIKMELQLANIYKRLHNKLCEEQYQDLIPLDLEEDLNELEDFLKQRKTVNKSIRNRLSQEVKKQVLKEQKEKLKINKSKASQALPRRGFQPKAITAGIDHIQLERLTQESTSALNIKNDAQDEDDEDRELDQEALNRREELEGGRSKPTCWEGLGDEVTIRVDRKDDEDGEDGEDGEEGGNHTKAINNAHRNAFLLMWANKADSELPNSGLKCSLCVADPTQSQKAKDAIYSLAKLNIHLRTATHSRKSQLMRAINLAIKAKDDSSMLECPICDGVPRGLRGNTSTKLMAHIEEAHPEELWEGSEAEDDDITVLLQEDDEVVAGPSSFAPRSTRTRPHSIAVDDEDVEESYMEPAPLYKGKGKAKGTSS